MDDELHTFIITVGERDIAHHLAGELAALLHNDDAWHGVNLMTALVRTFADADAADGETPFNRFLAYLTAVIDAHPDNPETHTTVTEVPLN